MATNTQGKPSNDHCTDKVTEASSFKGWFTDCNDAGDTNTTDKQGSRPGQGRNGTTVWRALSNLLGRGRGRYHMLQRELARSA